MKEDEEQPGVVRAHDGVPFKPQIPVTRTVELRPFSFDSKKSLRGEENKTVAGRWTPSRA